MARLPKVGGDDGSWGQVLNDYLSQSHNENGTLKHDTVGAEQLKPNAVTPIALADGSITNSKIAEGAVQSTQLADASVSRAKLSDVGVVNGVASLGADGRLPENEVPVRLGESELSATFAGLSDPAFVNQLKAGTGFIADRLTPAPAYNIPAITSATTPQISGGSLVQATGDYDNDTHYRYNGCSAVSSDGTWVAALSGQTAGNQILVPEFMTSEADIELKVRDGRTGNIGVRVIVDGRLTSGWQMQRVTGSANAARYLRLTFPDSRLRHIQVENDAFSGFAGVVAAPGALIMRPMREWSNRHVVIGDSLQAGAVTYEYLKYESHSRLTAFLLGADFYMNLGVGGTGWINENGAANQFTSRIPIARSANPQTLHFYGSRNDVNSALGDVRQRVIDTLALVADIPNVIVGAVAQAGYNTLSDAIRQGVVAAGRTYVDINALAQSNNTAPGGHPTLDEQIILGKAAFAQLDRARLEARAAASDASRPQPIVTLTTSGTPATVGASITFTAALSQALPGTVRFYAGTTLLGTGAVSGTTATLTTSSLTIGSYAVAARYVPSSTSVRPATSNTLTQVVALTLGLTDTFNRADGAVGNSDDGKTWSPTNSNGAWVISGNALANPTATSNTFDAIDPNTLYGTYEMTFAGTFNNAARVAFALLNSNNHIFLSCGGGSNNWRLWSQINAASAALATGATGSGWVAGDTVTVVIAPTPGLPTSADITVSKNGSVVIPKTSVDISPYGGATRFGFGVTAASTACKLDYVKMTPA